MSKLRPPRWAPLVLERPLVRRAWLAGVSLILVSTIFAVVLYLRQLVAEERIQSRYAEHGSFQKRVASAIESAGGFLSLSNELKLEGFEQPLIVQYSFDSSLQRAMEALYREYRPDYGAFVAMDAVTGRVLALLSYEAPGRRRSWPKSDDGPDHLALRATFPSASVFKVVTAAAVIAEKDFSGDTVITFNGRNHTLYRSNVLKNEHNRWTRSMTLRDAFARSVNTVFGKIGAFSLSAGNLRDYAGRLGFNRKIAGEIPIQESVAKFGEDRWEMAEAASGFTKDNRMSPMQGALMAAAIVNDGVMMEPWVVGSVHRQDGTQVYDALPKVASEALDVGTARAIRGLMRETIRRGTSRGSFRGFGRGLARAVEVGGKTGSLKGDDPPGKYDWFVGYADNGPDRIAIAALTVHKEYWRVKSSYLARRAIEYYFKARR